MANFLITWILELRYRQRLKMIKFHTPDFKLLEALPDPSLNPSSVEIVVWYRRIASIAFMQNALSMQRQQLAARRRSALECEKTLREVLHTHHTRLAEAVEASLVSRKSSALIRLGL